MRGGLGLLVMMGGCAASQATPVTTTGSIGVGSTPDHAEPRAMCIVNPKEKLTIVWFMTNQGEKSWANRGDASTAIRSTTDAFRQEARNANLALSGYDSHTLRERTAGGCTAPLLTVADPSWLAEDAACMTHVAERLNTEWFLSGFVDPAGSGFVVEAQLVRAGAPQSARVLKFNVSDPKQVSTQVHTAWLSLTSP